LEHYNLMYMSVRYSQRCKLELNSQKIKLGAILSVWALIVMALSGTITALVIKYVLK